MSVPLFDEDTGGLYSQGWVKFFKGESVNNFFYRRKLLRCRRKIIKSYFQHFSPCTKKALKYLRNYQRFLELITSCFLPKAWGFSNMTIYTSVKYKCQSIIFIYKTLLSNHHTPVLCPLSHLCSLNFLHFFLTCLLPQPTNS